MNQQNRNKFRRRVKRRLRFIDRSEEDAFNRWLDQIKSSKNSVITDLPSSQIVPRMSLISTDYPQLFVVVDTCSLVKHRVEFMDFVVRQKQLFSSNITPIRFIISCTVLEELDKCNRPTKRRRGQQEGEQQVVVTSGLKTEAQNDKKTSPVDPTTKDVIDFVSGRPGDPPRMFMRFIEEEMRASEVLVPELDPFKRTQLQAQDRQFEIINKDDRILECCLRSKAFVEAARHHLDTRVILVTEDNVFKAKATTFMLTSYRWREFKHKYQNFGLEHYRSTPMIPPQRLVIRNIDRSPGIKKGSHNSNIMDNDESTNIASCLPNPTLINNNIINSKITITQQSQIKSQVPIDIEPAKKRGKATTGTLLASQKFNRLCGPEFGGCGGAADSNIADSEGGEDDSVTIVGELINME